MTATAGRGRRAATKVSYRHPVNQELYGRPPLGARVADAVTTFIGSWKSCCSISMRSRSSLLNLAFSTQAAYAAPLILLAGNRQSIRDRMTLEHAASQSDVEEHQNEQLLRDDKEILEHVAALEGRILELEEKILAAIGGSRGTPAA